MYLSTKSTTQPWTLVITNFQRQGRQHETGGEKGGRLCCNLLGVSDSVWVGRAVSPRVWARRISFLHGHEAHRDCSDRTSSSPFSSTDLSRSCLHSQVPMRREPKTNSECHVFPARASGLSTRTHHQFYTDLVGRSLHMRSIGRTNIGRPLFVNGIFGYPSLGSSTSCQFTITYASIIEPTTGRPDLNINPSAARQPSRGSPKIGKRQTAEQTQNLPADAPYHPGCRFRTSPLTASLSSYCIILSSIAPDHHSLFAPSYLCPLNFFLPPSPRAAFLR
jgi:hypothetical protein